MAWCALTFSSPSSGLTARSPQALIPLLRGPLRLLDVLCTPRTFPTWTPDATDVSLRATLTDAPAPLRKLFPASLFTSLELVQNQCLGSLLDTLAISSCTDKYAAAMVEYRTQVYTLFMNLADAHRQTHDAEESPDVHIVLSDLENKLNWIFRSQALAEYSPPHWPLLTPGLMMHLHKSLFQVHNALSQVWYFSLVSW